MADILEMIRRDVTEDGMLRVHGLMLDVSRKGFLRKQSILTVSGTVASDHELKKLESIVAHHVGDAYTVTMNVAVDASLHAST